MIRRRCSRTQPCENCRNRGEEQLCIFSPGPESRHRHDSGSNRSHKILPDTERFHATESLGTHDSLEVDNDNDKTLSEEALQDRIHRLENAVLSLTRQQPSRSEHESPSNQALSSANGAEPSAEPGPPAIDQGDKSVDLAQPSGLLRSNHGQSTYHSSAHWTAILSDIGALKGQISGNVQPLQDSTSRFEALRASNHFTSGPIYTFSGGEQPSLNELRASLPGFDLVDKLIGRYFDNYDHTQQILHRPSFLREYHASRANLDEADSEWLAQVYAIMCMAISSYYHKGDEPLEFRGRTLNVAAKYRSMTERCLLLADWANPSQRMLQILLLHLYGDYLKGRDANLDDWVLGAMVRINPTLKSRLMKSDHTTCYAPRVSP